MITMWLKKKVQYPGFLNVQLDRVPGNREGTHFAAAMLGTEREAMFNRKSEVT